MFLYGSRLEGDDNTIYSYDVSPKFSNLSYSDYRNNPELRYIEVMTAYELDTMKMPNLNESDYIAEEKFDGHRSLMFITSEGNRFFSRNISKKTNWFTENSDLLPHLRDFDFSSYVGTVLDGELVLNIAGREDSTTVQTVLGSLPERALEMQLEYGFVTYNVFDILYYKGVKVQNMPLFRRKYILRKVLMDLQHPYIKFVPMYVVDKEKALQYFSHFMDDVLIQVEGFYPLFQDFISQGKEGLILKVMDGKYENKRSKNFLKMKGKTTWDVVITGYTEPEKEYYGKGEGTWSYWIDENNNIIIKDYPFDRVPEGLTPVTKFYAHNWIGSIKFGVYKDGELIDIGECSGLTEELREEISRNREKYIGKTIEVLGQGILDKEKGTIRHPRFYRFSSKNPEDCTFESLMNMYV